MAKYIIAHDAGTNGHKAVLVDAEGRVHGKCFEPYRTHYVPLKFAVFDSARVVVEHVAPDGYEVLGIYRR